MRRALFAFAALILSGCASATLPLPYAPTAAPAQEPVARASLAMGEVTDRRDIRDRRWVGNIRDGFGTPLKRLRSDLPVDTAVDRAFRDALLQRGLLAPSDGARLRLDIVIDALDANQLSRREARVVLRPALVDVASGAHLWTTQTRAERVEGRATLTPSGAYGSLEDLHALMVRVLAEAVDKVLDDPGLRDALRRAPRPA